jgi:hypothetical protein
VAIVGDLVETPTGRTFYVTVYEPSEVGGFSSSLWKTWRLLRFPDSTAVVVRDPSLLWAVRRQLFRRHDRAVESARRIENVLRSGELKFGWLPDVRSYRPTD